MFKKFSTGLLGLYEVWHCHDEAVPLTPLGLDVFCELHPEDSTQPNSTMHNSHFHQASENELAVFPETTTKRRLCCGFRRTGKAMGQVNQCWWSTCRETKVFPVSNITFFALYIQL
jgi:hypothetical protein